jgi:hypothetical protein
MNIVWYVTRVEERQMTNDESAMCELLRLSGSRQAIERAEGQDKEEYELFLTCSGICISGIHAKSDINFALSRVGDKRRKTVLQQGNQGHFRLVETKNTAFQLVVAQETIQNLHSGRN